MQIWLTQSKLVAEPIMKQLTAKGVNVKHCPVLVAEPILNPEPVIKDSTFVIMSSRNAIWYWCQNFKIPRNVVVMGPSSAAWAKICGIENSKHASQEGSEALLKYLLDLAVNDVVIATAESRRGILEQGLVDAGVAVRVLELYRNNIDVRQVNIILENFIPGDMVVVASMQAAEVLVGILGHAIWLTVSQRLADGLIAHLALGKVVNVGSTLGLADSIFSCYLDHK